MSEKSSDSIHHDADQGQGKLRCIFVHGWGMNSAIWQPLFDKLPKHIEPVCIDLPGHGKFNQQSFSTLQDLTDHLSEQTKSLPGSAIWVGWSLGMLPILQMAQQQPEKVSRLMAFSSNPRFVAGDSWAHGVEEAVFDLFAENLQANIEKTLQRFLSLQVQGMSDSRELLRQLRQLILDRGLPSAEALTAGLKILKETDLRELVNQLEQPVDWWLGDKDTLVPASLNDYLTSLSQVKSHIIAGAAHLPFISHTDQLLPDFLDFIND